MVATPAMPPWRILDAPPAPSLDHPDAWAYRGVAEVERACALDEFGHDDLAPRALDVLVAMAHQQHERRRRVVAVEDGADGPRVVGTGLLVLPLSDNLHLAMPRVAVLPSHRGRGIGTALAQELARTPHLEGRTTALAEVEFAVEPAAGAADALVPAQADGRVSADLPGVRFARRRGFRLEIVARRSVLEVPVPAAVVDRFVAEAAAHAGDDYRVRTWQDRIPDGWVDQYAALERRLSEDEPSGGLEVQVEHWDAARVRDEEAKLVERGQGALVTAVEHVPTATLAGMTVLEFAHDRPELTEQDSTVVLPEHRGHRLGMLVKAVNLREHARVRPMTRRISTWNNEANAPMLAINVALGFRPAGGSGELQAPLDVVRLGSA